jgi:hypothetical protein
MSIIGINGKIGSGKDTVGKIIQYLTSKQATSKGSYSYCEEMGLIYIVDWEIKKFAGKLKEIASLLTGIPVKKFEDQEFKKTNLSDEWSSLQQSGRNKVWDHMTVREFLQKLGTEAMREGLHTNVWVNALFADYKAGDPEYDAFYPNWIITDMRFPNEMEAVVAKGGITIRVVRPGTTVGTHPSETSLDGNIMHYEIINDGTIEDLVERVREILTERGII